MTHTSNPNDLTPKEIAELGDIMLSHPNEWASITGAR